MAWPEADNLAYPLPEEEVPPPPSEPIPVTKAPKVTPKSPAISDIKAPSMRDPRWKDWSAPILKYLGEARTWEQLEAWRKEVKINGSLLRHCLAWLEEMGFIHSTYVKVPEKIEEEVEEKVERKKGGKKKKVEDDRIITWQRNREPSARQPGTLPGVKRLATGRSPRVRPNGPPRPTE